MNKGLEVIEAHELFGVPYDAHRRGRPPAVGRPLDGRVRRRRGGGPAVPARHAPAHRLRHGLPRPAPDVPFGAIDWTPARPLEFEQPDRSCSACLDLAYRAGPRRATWPRPGSTPPTRWRWRRSWPAASGGRHRRGRGGRARRLRGRPPARPRPLGCPHARTVEDVLDADASRPTDRRPGDRRRGADGDEHHGVQAPGRAVRTGAVRRRPAAGPRESLFPEKVKSPRRSAVELVVTVAAIVAVATLAGAARPGDRARRIIAMVMVHELGHLLAAKRGGMKVTEYFLGFGPRLWSVRRGETEYGVKAIPAGGYVKIPGMTNLEEVDPARRARGPTGSSPSTAACWWRWPGRRCTSSWGSSSSGPCCRSWASAVPGQVQIQGFAPSPGSPTRPSRPASARATSWSRSTARRDDGQRSTSPPTRSRPTPGSPSPWWSTGAARTSRSRSPRSTAGTDARAGYSAPTGNAPYGIIGISDGNPTGHGDPGAGRRHRRGRPRPTSSGPRSWASVHIFSPLAPWLGASTRPPAPRRPARRPTTAPGSPRSSGRSARRTRRPSTGCGDLLDVLITIIVFLGVINLFPLLPLDGGHVADRRLRADPEPQGPAGATTPTWRR